MNITKTQEMSQELISRLYAEIENENRSETENSMPESDIFLLRFEQKTGTVHNASLLFLDILEEAHRIFRIPVYSENASKDLLDIECYVCSDPEIISEQLRIQKNFLTSLLQTEDYTLEQVRQKIQKEAEIFAGTRIDAAVSKITALSGCLQMMKQNPDTYTQTFMTEKTKELINRKIKELFSLLIYDPERKEILEQPDEKIEKALNSASARRAIDLPEIRSFDEDKKIHPAEKILSIYGADFFFRVHLRRYEFKLLTEIIDKGVINSKAQLISLRAMLKQVKANIGKDPKLTDYLNDIFDLNISIINMMPMAS